MLILPGFILRRSLRLSTTGLQNVGGNFSNDSKYIRYYHAMISPTEWFEDRHDLDCLVDGSPAEVHEFMGRKKFMDMECILVI